MDIKKDVSPHKFSLAGFVAKRVALPIVLSGIGIIGAREVSRLLSSPLESNVAYNAVPFIDYGSTSRFNLPPAIENPQSGEYLTGIAELLTSNPLLSDNIQSMYIHFKHDARDWRQDYIIVQLSRHPDPAKRYSVDLPKLEAHSAQNTPGEQNLAVEDLRYFPTLEAALSQAVLPYYQDNQLQSFVMDVHLYDARIRGKFGENSLLASVWPNLAGYENDLTEFIAEKANLPDTNTYNLISSLSLNLRITDQLPGQIQYEGISYDFAIPLRETPFGPHLRVPFSPRYEEFVYTDQEHQINPGIIDDALRFTPAELPPGLQKLSRILDTFDGNIFKYINDLDNPPIQPKLA